MSREARVFARSLVNDPEYRKKLLEDLRARRLAPQLESMLWAYAWGKPPDRIEVGRIGEEEALMGLSNDDLIARLEAVKSEIAALGEGKVIDLVPAPMGELEGAEAAGERLQSTTPQETTP